MPYRSEKIELVLFLILTFMEVIFEIPNPLAATTHTIRELVLFRSSFISSQYGVCSTQKS